MVLLALALLQLCLSEKEKGRAGIGQLLLGQVEEAMAALWCPALTFANQEDGENVWQAVAGPFPLFCLYGKESGIRLQSENSGTYEEIIQAEGRDEEMDSVPEEALKTPESSAGKVQVGERESSSIFSNNSSALFN